MQGYSQLMIENNTKASETSGTLLGKLCIALKYPASQVAKDLNVSRQTVYDWFSGRAKPSRRFDEVIKALSERISKK